jgi:D-apionate oxidoisomerase
MTKIALFGAGGKMGRRLSRNLLSSDLEVAHVEVVPHIRDALKDEMGITCVEPKEALAGASAVILAVPDRQIGKVYREYMADFPPGTLVIVLDAAAPHSGEMPLRPDLPLFVTHPCHPPLFNDETDPSAKADYFGGVAARQAIVCAIENGTEDDYALGERIARLIYAPVTRAHRCTVRDIAILEPAMSETVGATLALALREATEMAIRQGVPREAAMDFMLGHLNIELAIAFGVFPGGKFSDGALKAIDEARPVIFRDGWLEDVFRPEAVLASVRSIAGA